MRRNRELFRTLNLELVKTKAGFDLNRHPSVSPRIVWPILMLPIFVVCLIVGQTVPAVLTGGALVILYVATMRGWSPVVAHYVAGGRVLTTATDVVALTRGSRLQTKKHESGPVEIFVASGSQEHIIYRWDPTSQYYDIPYPDVVSLATRMSELMQVEVDMGPGIEPGFG